jgi:hypothetical protein
MTKQTAVPIQVSAQPTCNCDTKTSFVNQTSGKHKHLKTPASTFITKNYYHNGQDLKNYAKSDFKIEKIWPESLYFVN